MATAAYIAHFLLEAATAIAGLIMVAWIGIAYLLSYSD